MCAGCVPSSSSRRCSGFTYDVSGTCGLAPWPSLALHVEAGEVSIHCNIEVHIEDSRSMAVWLPPAAGYVAVRLAGEVKMSSFFLLS